MNVSIPPPRTCCAFQNATDRELLAIDGPIFVRGHNHDRVTDLHTHPFSQKLWNRNFPPIQGPAPLFNPGSQKRGRFEFLFRINPIQADIGRLAKLLNSPPNLIRGE